MQDFQTFLRIPALLSSEQLSQIDQMLGMAHFVDGAVTATAAARRVKQNLQIDPNQNADLLENVVVQALHDHPHVRDMVLPRYILPPLFSKYESAMTYGYHVDNPLMSKKNHPPIRTDLACTVFLSAKADYKGGELEIISEGKTQQIKLDKGDAIIYPTQFVHQVTPVTSGTRVAAITWMQSMVRSIEQREVLYQLKALYDHMTTEGEASQEALVILQSYSNLMKMWAEL